MKIMNNQQLALELPIATCRRSHRSLRAQWWFERMRQIIDLAPDPEPIAEQSRPAQERERALDSYQPTSDDPVS
jgi:hypothetical protein